jgi:hypothetical protein
MSRLEAIAVDDWPGIDVSEPALAKFRQSGLPSGSMSRIRYDLAKVVRFGATESVESLVGRQYVVVERVLCQMNDTIIQLTRERRMRK